MLLTFEMADLVAACVPCCGVTSLTAAPSSSVQRTQIWVSSSKVAGCWCWWVQGSKDSAASKACWVRGTYCRAGADASSRAAVLTFIGSSVLSTCLSAVLSRGQANDKVTLATTLPGNCLTLGDGKKPPFVMLAIDSQQQTPQILPGSRICPLPLGFVLHYSSCQPDLAASSLCCCTSHHHGSLMMPHGMQDHERCRNWHADFKRVADCQAPKSILPIQY
jgi:hypothetical protein